jgi:GABA(A) receptor-associated protein
MYNHNTYNNNHKHNNYNSNSYLNHNNTFTITGSWTNNNTEKKSFSKFRNQYTFEERINESRNIMLKYPDRIPVICEKGIGADNPNIDKNKYLVPMDLTVGNFLVVIRKKIKLQNYEALFLMINNTIPPSTTNFKELYHRHKDTDGYLYMTYTKENVFG